MKEKITLEGRSLVFNILFVLLNLTGVTFIVLGFHSNFEEQHSLFRLIGMVLLIGTIAAIVVFKGKLLMSSVSRVLVGGLFIVSGLIKANDPVGFSYKLEEYFEDGALAFRIKEWFSAPGFSLEALMDYALLLSVIICIAEIVLGVLLIIGGKIKLTSYLSLFMMIFFTFLTWHTSDCNPTKKFLDRDTYQMTNPNALAKIEEAKTNEDLKIHSQTKSTLVVDEMKLPQCVDDCGCFGDAMKGSAGRSLTPSESYWKDIVLVYLLIWIFASQWIIKPNTRKENIVFGGTSLIVILFLSWVFGWYFPVWFSIVSILGAFWMLRAGGKVFGNYYGSALFIILITLALEVYVISYLPIKDYRPYSIGSNLTEKMNDGIDGVYESLLVYKNTKTGDLKEYSSSSEEYMNSKIWEDKEWVYESMVQKAIVPQKNPSIMDFKPFIQLENLSENEKALPMIQQMIDTSQVELLKILSIEYDSYMEIPFEEYSIEGFPAEEYTIVDTVRSMNPAISDFDITNSIIAQEKIVLMISRKLKDADWRNMEAFKSIYEECKENNVPFIFICNATQADIDAFRKKHNFPVATFVMDEIELKVISRSNPSIVVLEKGTVTGKMPFRTIPSRENFKSKYLN